jgi:hypothetical protein
MLNMILVIAAMGGSMWLAIAAVDMVVDIIRHEWRFSLLSMLKLTAVICVILGAMVALKNSN